MAYGVILGQTQEQTAQNTSYDNSQTSSIITSNNVQGAVDQLFTSVSNGKNQIANAITGKGISASGNDTFAILANKISSITASPILNSFILNSLISATMTTNMSISVANQYSIVYSPSARWKGDPVDISLDTSGGIVDYTTLQLKSYNNGFSSVAIRATYNYNTNTLSWNKGRSSFVKLTEIITLPSGMVQLKYSLIFDTDFVLVSGNPYILLQTKSNVFNLRPKNESGYQWPMSAPYNSVMHIVSEQ